MREFYEDVWEQLPDGLAPFALERRRAFLLEHVEPGQRVLDLGCGDGALTAALRDAGAEAVGAEIAQAALHRARERHPGPRYELVPPHGPLPFPDGAFDVVWASEVIEHVADTERWLNEIRRVLRPAGLLLVTTPYHGRVKNLAIAATRFEAHADPRGQHLRFYTRRSLRELLAAFGFEAIELSAAGGPPFLRETLLAAARRS